MLFSVAWNKLLILDTARPITAVDKRTMLCESTVGAHL